MMSKVLLFVHGAGKTDPDYAVGPLAAITALLGVEPPCVPVYYADVIKLGSSGQFATVLAAGQPPNAMEPFRTTQFKTAFAKQVQSSLNASQLGDQAVSVSALPGLDIAELIAIEVNEVAGYLFNPMFYNQIQSRMYAGLNKAARMGDSVVVVSHSLGSIVAFDCFRALGGRYNVSTFLTLGSPLGILRRLGNRSSDLGSITCDHVGTWLNFYDTTDPVSNALGPFFPQPGYRLRDVFVDISSAPIPAHDYFPNPEVLGEIARALR